MNCQHHIQIISHELESNIHKYNNFSDLYTLIDGI